MTAEKDVDPTDSLWALLAFHVRRLRKERGWTQEKLAEEAHSTSSTVGAVETLERKPKPDLAAAIDKALGAGGMLIDLAHHARILSAGMPRWFETLTKAERDAARIRTFEPQAIPGLLQCEEYARAQFAALRDGEELETRVAARMARQEVLSGDKPLKLWAILDEAVLLRVAATPGVARPQLTHLLKMAERPNIVIEVLPLGCGIHACMDGGFVLLTMRNRSEAAYIEAMGEGHLISQDDRGGPVRASIRSAACRDVVGLALHRVHPRSSGEKHMSMASSQNVTWRKSSYSGNQGGNCVEVASLDGVGVRDSKDVRRGHLTIRPAAWETLTAALKR
ncbi:Scr1 family TA system antitoxin-like transcriptional regulator [Yinghuangia sp. YIM S10712]|uniref:Scr1 family TA system antitoxin-like transcriptional regulator n=1 Tax=Yinghuangia sp. YIM S10712 TaxID=3436930 RepID=UPI003F533688